MRVAYACAALLLAGLLAGCAAPEGGALNAYGSADDAARAWSSDAVLVGLVGIEAAENATFEGLEEVPGVDLAQIADSNVGDGLAPYWLAMYHSEEKMAVVAIAVLDGDVQDPIELPFGAGDLPGLSSSTATPDLDSTDIVAALSEHDVAIATVLEGGELAHVMYGYSPQEDAWMVHGETADGRELMATVHDADAAVASATLDTQVPLPPQPIPAIYDNVTVVGAADPMNLVTGAPCETPQNACSEYEFSLDRVATMDASLEWDFAANDFDFYLYSGSEQVISGASDITSGPGNAEHMAGKLQPGDYRIVVVPWSVTIDEYRLAVTFE